MQNCMTLVRIAMAPTAISPPYLWRDVLKQTEITLSVNCMMNGETPSPMLGRMTGAESFRFFTRIRRVLFFEVRKTRTHTKETACDRMVASAAPCTPMWKPKIKMGSRMMLQTAPMATVHIPVMAKPCALMNAFSPREIWTKIVPMA